MSATHAVPVDPTNAEQARAWDGDEGSYWATHADHFERALTAYESAFFEAAEIEGHDRVLDVGCGTGHTTRRAARTAAAGSVLGVDLSSAMLEVARQRARDEGLANVGFEQADAQIHPFEPESFDRAIGHTSAMFFGDRVAALANVGRALRPGGRLTLMTWGPLADNEWIREFTTAMAAGRELPAPGPDQPGPFTLADPDTIRSVLDAAGFDDVALEPRHDVMWFGTDADDTDRFVGGLLGWMLDGLDEDGQARARGSLRATIEAHATADGVLYRSATWIIGATRP